MNDVSVVGPDGGEVIDLGPARVRILEDGRTTAHRLGIGEIDARPAQYFRDLRDAAASGQPLTEQAITAVMGRYGTSPAAEFS